MDDNRNLPPSIADIPVEIIREILLCAYAAHAERFRVISALVWDADLASPSITPNSLSSVCQLWDAVLADIPDFWKHVVVHIDQPEHLEFFRAALERSRGADIESVTIVNSTQGVDVNEKEEQEAIKAILSLIMRQDNQPRIRSLVVRARWSGSLPCNMVCPWHKLRALKMESELTSNTPYSGLPVAIPEAGPPSFPPSLSILSLTGPMLVNLWRDETGRSAMREKALLSFTVTCLRAEDGGKDPVTFHEFVKAAFAFANASMTNIVDIDVPVVYDNRHKVINQSSAYGDRVSFDRTPLALIIRLVDTMWGRYRGPSMELSSCKFHRCGELSASERGAIHGGRARRIKVLYAEVTEISHPTDLGLLLQRISAEELHIIRCPGFTDTVLPGLFVSEGTSSMERTHTLRITGCGNLSQRRLETLFVSRQGVKMKVRDGTAVITWAQPAAAWWRID